MHRVRPPRHLLAPVLVLTAVLPPLASAQVGSGEPPQSFAVPLQQDVPTVTLPRVDCAALLAEDALAGKIGPLRFGKVHAVDLSPFGNGVWEASSAAERVWRLRIACPEAYSINFVCQDFWLPPGARLHVYTDDRSVHLGAFTDVYNAPHGEFAIQPIPGEAITLEYVEPTAGLRGGFRVTEVVHGYRDLFGEEDDKAGEKAGSGSCNVNVNCPAGQPWQDQKRAVARIFLKNSYCSGVLVNNTAQDGRRFLLTANHCYDGLPHLWTVAFNFESATCAGTTGGLGDAVLGAALKAKHGASDFCLVELSQEIPDSYDVYLAGWDRSGKTPGSTVGIHHPQGDIKKICFDTDAAEKQIWAGADTWHIGDWELGVTEGGSSGSPLFDPSKRVIGQLYGGQAACGNVINDYYGRLDTSWDHGLAQYLDPGDTGAVTLDGLDPSSSSDVEFVEFASLDVPKAIPDGNLLGAWSQVEVSGLDQNVADLYVKLDVQHPRRGDLRIQLLRPDGAAIDLRVPALDEIAADVTGTFGDGLEPVDPLSSLFAGAANGTWRLRLFDLQPGDVGMLVSWSLGVKAVPGTIPGATLTRVYSASSALPKSVPDGKKNQKLKLKVLGQSGKIEKVVVTLDVVHDAPDDLLVRLIAPNKKKVTLVKQPAGSPYGLATSFPVYAAPVDSLAALLGVHANGTWKLLVKDLKKQNKGTIHDWTLRLTTK